MYTTPSLDTLQTNFSQQTTQSAAHAFNTLPQYTPMVPMNYRISRFKSNSIRLRRLHVTSRLGGKRERVNRKRKHTTHKKKHEIESFRNTQLLNLLRLTRNSLTVRYRDIYLHTLRKGKSILENAISLSITLRDPFNGTRHLNFFVRSCFLGW